MPSFGSFFWSSFVSHKTIKKMKNYPILKFANYTFIGFCTLSLLYVSVLAFINPQLVMDLVAVELKNTDAYSSIRGIYGGVGLAVVIMLVYFMFKNQPLGLVFLGLIWSLYAISRLITIFVEGTLGNFGSQWLVTESTLAILSLILLYLNKKFKNA